MTKARNWRKMASKPEKRPPTVKALRAKSAHSNPFELLLTKFEVNIKYNIIALHIKITRPQTKTRVESLSKC